MHGVAFAFGEICNLALGVFTVEQDAEGVFDQQFTFLGKINILWRTHNQLDTEFCLQGFDCHGDGGLRDKQLLAGASEAVIAIYCH